MENSLGAPIQPQPLAGNAPPDATVDQKPGSPHAEHTTAKPRVPQTQTQALVGIASPGATADPTPGSDRTDGRAEDE